MGTKLAVYTCALNEEKFVRRWYEATKDADYHIIADTGSIDKTVEIAKELGIQVYEISITPFRFDDARNAALALVPVDADICLSLDMDEVPEEGAIETIKKTWDPDTTRGWLWWETGSKWKNNNRLHARHGYRWIKPCHEVTMKYTPGDEVYIDYDLTVYHQPDDTKSRGQYLPMLEMAVKEDPRDTRMWHYYVRELFFHQKWEEVIFNAALGLKTEGGWRPERAAMARGAGHAASILGRKDEALKWFAKGANEAPDQLEAWFALAQHCYEIGNWEGCYKASSKRLDFKKPETHYLVDKSIWDWRCYDLMSISAYRTGKHKESIKWAKKAVKANPTDGRLRSNLKWLEDNVAA